MLTASELKTELQRISRSPGHLPRQEALPRLLEAMAAHLGSPDPELRDDLIYAAFARWIPEGALSVPQLKQLLLTALDDQHLFYRIGENGTDSVFIRSFSMLVLPLIVYAHLKSPFLSPDDIASIKTSLLRFTRLERDRRGYVEPHGWAHTVAHTADAVDELAKCGELEAKDLLDLLGAVYTLLTEPRLVYAFEEDERLSVAAVTILQRQLLALEDWEAWLDSLLALAQQPLPTPQALCQRVNIKHFLRAFYFRLRRPENAEALHSGTRESILAKLEEILPRMVRF